MYQPNRNSNDPYLNWRDLQTLIIELAPREINKTQVFQWLNIIDEPRRGLYSNFVAAQMLKFAQLRNAGLGMEQSKRSLAIYLDSFESDQEFIQEVFHEAQERCQPQLTWVFPRREQSGSGIIDITATIG